MSVLAKQIKEEHELSKEYLQVGFSHASKIGELLNEVESLVGAEEFETWLKKNCSNISKGEAEKYKKLFSGEKVSISLEVLREQHEVVE